LANLILIGSMYSVTRSTTRITTPPIGVPTLKATCR
jgi:hypothetical protein